LSISSCIVKRSQLTRATQEFRQEKWKKQEKLGKKKEVAVL
jgi:hypothetical protein